jgi:uncharacterized protein (DUF362 family)
MPHLVAIKHTSPSTLSGDLRDVIEKSGCLARLEDVRNVVLKPNLVTDKDEYIALGANTSVEVLEALLAILSDFGCKVGIGESETGTPVKGRRLRIAWEKMGIDRLAQRYGADLLSFSDLPSKDVPFDGIGPSTLRLPEAVLSCDLLIDIPKIKTHKYAGLTCSMKNLFGLVPEPRRIVYHRWLDSIIAQIAKTLSGKTIIVVDGLVGMEGNGPLYGEAVQLDLLMAGKNLWAVDRTVCDLISIPPERIGYLRIAEDLGLAEDGIIELVGDPMEGCRRPFKPVQFNPYRTFEKKLMESPLVHVVTSHWFQKHVSRHLGGLTQWLRGGGYSWYLDDEDS